ncbi:MAG: methionyl-tRNA formyltransferase [Treponema sp.]|nr:methionyl-tRNA formyltransferase [Treponema sp.]
MRILFAGSPAIAVPALEALFAPDGEGVSGAESAGGGGFELAGLLTNPDSPRGRSGKPEPTELGAAAERLNAALREEGKAPVPILKPEKLDGEARQQAASLEPELLVSFAYGRIFGPKFLALFPLGGINIHPSLLPRYRGPTPIQAAILGRETETGVTIQRLAPQMDSGDILTQERIPLDGRETAASLGGAVARKAAEMLPPALKGIAGGTIRSRPQDHAGASYCSLIAKEAGLIDWALSALEIDARIRAFDPWPLSWTTHGGRRLFILKAVPLDETAGKARPGQVLGIDKQRGILVQAGEGILAVSVLQYQGKKALEWKAFLTGARDFTGSHLGV